MITPYLCARFLKDNKGLSANELTAKNVDASLMGMWVSILNCDSSIEGLTVNGDAVLGLNLWDSWIETETGCSYCWYYMTNE